MHLRERQLAMHPLLTLPSKQPHERRVGMGEEIKSCVGKHNEDGKPACQDENGAIVG